MENNDLIEKAETAINRQTTFGRLHGDVGAAVLGKNGKVYLGTCIDTPSWGLCAERSAIAAMVSDGEYVIDKVVAVWRDDKTDKLHVLPPCGICREFMRQLHESNMDLSVVLGRDKTEKLKALIPYNVWPDPLD
jgi:cytidine deaminase